MGRASLKLSDLLVLARRPHLISRPYGPGLIEAASRTRRWARTTWISRPYGPGLIEASQ